MKPYPPTALSHAFATAQARSLRSTATQVLAPQRSACNAATPLPQQRSRTWCCDDGLMWCPDGADPLKLSENGCWASNAQACKSIEFTETKTPRSGPNASKGKKITAQDTEGRVEPIFCGFQSMHVLHVSRRIAIICQETTPESQSL